MICPACGHVIVGGRPRLLTDQAVSEAAARAAAGEPVTDVARDLNVSRATLYRRINEQGRR